jgi:hypothetical protein
MAVNQEKPSKMPESEPQNIKIDRNAPAGSKNSLGAQSVRRRSGSSVSFGRHGVFQRLGHVVDGSFLAQLHDLGIFRYLG